MLIVSNLSLGKKKQKTDYRDPEFYMSSERPLTQEYEDKFLSLETSVMDITPEDTESLRKTRAIYTWDKKKKKYVQQHVVAGVPLRLNSKIRNEAGKLVKKTDNVELYKQWQQKTKKRIQKVGEIEETDGVNEPPPPKRTDLPTHDDAKGKKGKRIKQELKTPEQIKKERKLKEKRQRAAKIKKIINRVGLAPVRRKLEIEGMIKKAQQQEQKRGKSKIIVKTPKDKKRKR